MFVLLKIDTYLILVPFILSVFVKSDDYLNGKLIITQGERKNVDEVAINESVKFFVDLYDPSGYLSEAEIDYMWSIDFERQSYLMNNFTYYYTSPEMSSIMSAVVARLKNDTVAFGYFSKQLNVKVPVQNVNVSGNPFIPHGNMLLLNITCNGSSPFMYCYEYLEANETSLNFSCGQPIMSTTCSFHVQRYFQNYGTYHVGIYISNGVREEKRIIEVVVYNVSKKPQLSTVIIPIVCSLLTLIIIAGGIAYCVQQRNQLVIEVANFDFQDDSESYVGRTFFEQIFDSFTCRACNVRSRIGSGDSESLSETTEPLLTSESAKSYS